MISSKKGGIGMDELVSLLLFMLAAAGIYIFLSVLHTAQKEQIKQDISDQSLRSQMESELLQFLQLPVGTTTVSDMLIEGHYTNDFNALSSAANSYFSDRKLQGLYDDWNLVIQQPKGPSLSLNPKAALAIANEHVAQAYLPLPTENDNYLEVKLFLFKTKKTG